MACCAGIWLASKILCPPHEAAAPEAGQPAIPGFVNHSLWDRAAGRPFATPLNKLLYGRTGKRLAIMAESVVEDSAPAVLEDKRERLGSLAPV